MREGIKTRLNEVDESRNCNQCPVDAPKRCKAEDFNRIITDKSLLSTDELNTTRKCVPTT